MISFVKNIEYVWSFQVVQLGSKVQTKTKKPQLLMSTLKFIGRSFCFACGKDIIRRVYCYPFQKRRLFGQASWLYLSSTSLWQQNSMLTHNEHSLEICKHKYKDGTFFRLSFSCSINEFIMRNWKFFSLCCFTADQFLMHFASHLPLHFASHF